MKKYISIKEETYYTHMLKVLKALGGRTLEYNWLITNIEAYPRGNNELIELMKDNEFLFLTSDELITMLEKNDFQWIWGVFSGIQKNCTKEEVLKYELPFADGNYDIYKNDVSIIQHPLADIEIVAFDASGFQIVSKQDDIVENFKIVYKNIKTNY